MVYMVFDGADFLRCVSQDWPTAYGVLSQLVATSVHPPKMEVYPERAFALGLDSEQ